MLCSFTFVHSIWIIKNYVKWASFRFSSSSRPYFDFHSFLNGDSVWPALPQWISIFRYKTFFFEPYQKPSRNRLRKLLHRGWLLSGSLKFRRRKFMMHAKVAGRYIGCGRGKTWTIIAELHIKWPAEQWDEYQELIARHNHFNSFSKSIIFSENIICSYISAISTLHI